MTAPSPAGLSPVLDQLAEARAKGTQGEWHVASSGGIDAGDYDTVIGRGPVDCMARCYGGTSTLDGDNLVADLALIVDEHNAFPKLTAALRAVAELAQELAGKCPPGDWGSGGIEDAIQADTGRAFLTALTAALTPGADTAGATA